MKEGFQHKHFAEFMPGKVQFGGKSYSTRDMGDYAVGTIGKMPGSLSLEPMWFVFNKRLGKVVSHSKDEKSMAATAKGLYFDDLKKEREEKDHPKTTEPVADDRPRQAKGVVAGDAQKANLQDHRRNVALLTQAMYHEKPGKKG